MLVAGVVALNLHHFLGVQVGLVVEEMELLLLLLELLEQSILVAEAGVVEAVM
jgi:hypothetical protein